MAVEVATVGKEVSRIPLKLSYRMIDLFSGQLYSSSSKAVEELVVNSYDAFAQDCRVVLPFDWSSPNAAVAVWDDGDSMDMDGLKDLWLVASSKKRLPEKEAAARTRGRPPIGKFGIGKLASYVLGRRISHICHSKGETLAVTMDFARILPPDGQVDERPDTVSDVDLSVRKISTTEIGALVDGVELAKYLPDRDRLHGSQSWTLVIVDQLKSGATDIQEGRLRWVISTALPNSPDFSVSINGERVESAKSLIPKIRSWQIGDNDSSAQSLGYDTSEVAVPSGERRHAVIVPGIGPVWGAFDLYEDSLLGGKAGEVGRSNGFFIMVRNRLVNYQDPLFGLPALTYGPFSRLNAVINADGLDQFLVASRENVSDGPRVALQAYLSSKFQEVRSYWEKFEEENKGLGSMDSRLRSLPSALVRLPLHRAVDRIAREGGTSSGTIRTSVPDGEVKDQPISFTSEAEDPSDTIAHFDFGTGALVVNASHPFYVNSEDSSTVDSIATAEILLEAYLRETSLPETEIFDVLRKRDALLRAIVRQSPHSVITLAEALRDAAHNERGLEVACHNAFAALGFDVLRLGSKGEPEGVASAPLATRFAPTTGTPIVRSYSLTYDAKSTVGERVKSGNIGMATIARHRDRYKANYAVVVAPDFEVTRGEESKAIEEARRESVCLVRVNDFATLLEASGSRPLPLPTLEELFKGCRSPEESAKWISEFCSKPAPTALIPAILHGVAKLQKEHPEDQPSFAGVKHGDPRLAAVPERQIRDWVEALQRLVPDLVSVYGDRVELNQAPENVLTRIRKDLQGLPS
jgi:hypothetical protein